MKAVQANLGDVKSRILKEMTEGWRHHVLCCWSRRFRNICCRVCVRGIIATRDAAKGCSSDKLSCLNCADGGWKASM